LFEPFVQGERRLDSSTGGLGLGLPLVEGLVTLHGGRVRASSRGPGHGATFVVTLPRTAAPEPARASPEVAPTGRRILIVEDNEDAGTMLAMLLEFDGHTVSLAGDGESGVSLSRTFRPEVVLCDIGLPGALDGYGVARALRTVGSGAEHAFLVALSGYGQTEDQRLAKEAGFDRHVTKPVDPSALSVLISQGR
jgi:CheY-like chemotaxis protein